MLSFLQAPLPRKRTCHETTVKYDAGHSPVTFLGSEPGQKYLMRATIKGSKVDQGRGPSIHIPPTHWHGGQSENFHVVSGHMGAWMEGKSVVLSAGENIIIPPLAHHKFDNASETEPLIVEVGLDPENRSKDERFFRNFFGYMEDCMSTRTQPSLMQMMLFLYESDTYLAIPLLPSIIANPLSIILGWFLGVFIGKWILGYKGSYLEYY